MTDRRDVLKLLGLGGGTVALGGVGVWQSGLLDPDNGSSDGPKTESGSSGIDSLSEMRAAVADAAPSRETMATPIDFGYEPLDLSTDDPVFSHVVATPADAADGDRLRIDPTDDAGDLLVAVLRGIWGVGTDESVSTSLGDQSVTLRGGSSSTREIAALLGVVSGAAQPHVVVVRGATLDDATALASDLSSIAPE